MDIRADVYTGAAVNLPSRRMLYSPRSDAGSEFSQILSEAAAALAPGAESIDALRDAAGINAAVRDQTALVNLLSAAPGNIAALQPAMMGYGVVSDGKSGGDNLRRLAANFSERAAGRSASVRVAPVNESVSADAV